MSSKPKIFYVEDDETLSFITKDQLEEEGFEITHYSNGKKAVNEFGDKVFDLAILDIMLPEIDGFTIAKNIREQNKEIPILFLSAKSLKEDKLKGFETGADDYLTKPFDMEELIYKIRVFLKRKSIVNPSKSYKIGEYSFEPTNLLLSYKEENKELTSKEADLLLLLIENKNTTVTREDILVKLWGKNDYFLGRSLDVFISRLRKYLEKDKSISINTLRGVGFRLEIN